jgi:hypothetical protein
VFHINNFFSFFFSSRPRVWFRDLLFPDQLFHRPESLAETRFRLHGQLKDVEVEAKAHQRQGNGWKLTFMKVTILDDTRKEFVVFDKKLMLPENMGARKLT